MKDFSLSGFADSDHATLLPVHEAASMSAGGKRNWMVAASLAAIGGFVVIGGTMWLIGSGGKPRLETRAISPSVTVSQTLNTAVRPKALNANLRSMTASKSDRMPTAAGPALAARMATTVIAKTHMPEDEGTAGLAAAAPKTTDLAKTEATEEPAAQPAAAPAAAISPEPELKTAAVAEAGTTDQPEEIVISIEKGDTIFGVLTRSGIDKGEAYEISSRLTKVFDVSDLRQGHALRMTMAAPGAGGALRPERLVLDAGKTMQVELKLTESGAYEIVRKGPAPAATAARKTVPVRSRKKATAAATTTAYQRTRSKIQSSFYTSAVNQNVPRRIINKMSSVLAYGVDFQREISRGDVYEVFYANEGRDEGVLYSELNARGKKHAYYRFKTKSGDTGYYDVKGNSARKSLMRTPIHGARITSGFGRRRHPILKYNKMHTGIDFGAPRGTPIYAAADGQVAKAGWAGGYGKYVRISHSRKLATAYGHMSRIARGIRPGKKVSQGQIIGYVGSTGRSTGPHLHYEIRVSGRAVNPLRYKGASKTAKLSGRQLAAFRKEMARIDRLRSKTAVSTYVAEAGR